MSGLMGRRTDVVANAMGKMLLQGYKMLDRSCQQCNSVLLQDKQGDCYCVACETSKNLDGSGDEPIEMEANDNKMTDSYANVHELETNTVPIVKSLINATEVLIQEIVNSANELQLNTGKLSIPEKSKYVSYIGDCAKAITAIQAVKSFESK